MGISVVETKVAEDTDMLIPANNYMVNGCLLVGPFVPAELVTKPFKTPVAIGPGRSTRFTLFEFPAYVYSSVPLARSTRQRNDRQGGLSLWCQSTAR